MTNMNHSEKVDLLFIEITKKINVVQACSTNLCSTLPKYAY